MKRHRLKDGRPRKPTEKELAWALKQARFFFSVNADTDDYQGKVAEELIGPLLWAYDELERQNALLRRDVQTLMNRT